MFDFEGIQELHAGLCLREMILAHVEESRPTVRFWWSQKRKRNTLLMYQQELYLARLYRLAAQRKLAQHVSWLADSGAYRLVGVRS